MQCYKSYPEKLCSEDHVKVTGSSTVKTDAYGNSEITLMYDVKFQTLGDKVDKALMRQSQGGMFFAIFHPDGNKAEGGTINCLRFNPKPDQKANCETGGMWAMKCPSGVNIEKTTKKF